MTNRRLLAMQLAFAGAAAVAMLVLFDTGGVDTAASIPAGGSVRLADDQDQQEAQLQEQLGQQEAQQAEQQAEEQNEAAQQQAQLDEQLANTP
ncbi:MAG: hypothetical protein ACLPXZ_23270 [Mycobacterium sp.]